MTSNAPIRPAAVPAPRKSRAPGRSRVGALDRIVQILDHLRDTGAAATAYDIAKSIGAPLSTVYSLVDEMEGHGLVTRPDGRSVWLGPRLLHYGLAYEAKADALSAARVEMGDLSEELGETVQVCVRDGGLMVVAAMAEGPGHFRISSNIGTRVPLNWTASGRLLVGDMPQPEMERLFAEVSMPSPTGLAVTDPVELARQARQDFEARLAVQLGASEFAVACVASPIRDKDGHCVATISAVLPEQKATKDIEGISRAVQRAAARVERAIGRS